MGFSGRFLNLVKQQLINVGSESSVEQLVVYAAQAREGDTPSLEALGCWPGFGKALPPVEAEAELLSPSPYRRWYPLQEGSILLGVLRVEISRDNQVWSESLDQKFTSFALTLTQVLGLELERAKLAQEITEQKEYISLTIHQLRNPLAALRTYAQLLMRKIGPNSKHKNLVEGLILEQDQLNKYVSALDKITQAKLTPQHNSPVPLLLPPVLSKASESNIKSLLKPLLDRASARANLQGRQWYEPSKWPDWAYKPCSEDQTVIAEIVANLIENAFQYSNLKPIGLHVNDQGLCVWDEGKPITSEERESIFKKGFRGTSSGNSPGTGLGLALGRQLAEGIGSKLELIVPPSEFDSKLPKTGNAFVIKIH